MKLLFYFAALSQAKSFIERPFEMIDLSEQDTIFDRLVREASLDDDEGSAQEELPFNPEPKAPQPDEPIPGPLPTDTGLVPKPSEPSKSLVSSTESPALTQTAVNEDLKNLAETEVIEESIDTTPPSETTTGGSDNNSTTIQTSTSTPSDNSNTTTVITTTQAGTTKADSSATSVSLSTLIIMTVLSVSWAL